MTDLLHSEQLTIIATLVAGLWTLFKTTEFWQRHKHQRYERAVTAIEAGVEETYRTWIKGLKVGKEDGKLTKQEQCDARELARRYAIEYGKTKGVDVAKELGSELIELWITRMVKKLKGS